MSRNTVEARLDRLGWVLVGVDGGTVGLPTTAPGGVPGCLAKYSAFRISISPKILGSVTRLVMEDNRSVVTVGCPSHLTRTFQPRPEGSAPTILSMSYRAVSLHECHSSGVASTGNVGLPFGPLIGGLSGTLSVRVSGIMGNACSSTSGSGNSGSWKNGAAKLHFRSDCHGSTSGTDPSVGTSSSTACGLTASTVNACLQARPLPCLRM